MLINIFNLKNALYVSNLSLHKGLNIETISTTVKAIKKSTSIQYYPS